MIENIIDVIFDSFAESINFNFYTLVFIITINLILILLYLKRHNNKFIICAYVITNIFFIGTLAIVAYKMHIY